MSIFFPAATPNAAACPKIGISGWLHLLPSPESDSHSLASFFSISQISPNSHSPIHPRRQPQLHRSRRLLPRRRRRPGSQASATPELLAVHVPGRTTSYSQASTPPGPALAASKAAAAATTPELSLLRGCSGVFRGKLVKCTCAACVWCCGEHLGAQAQHHCLVH